MMKSTIILNFIIGILLAGGMGTSQAAEPVKIAAIFAKTGIAANDDFYRFRLADMAVEEINAKGGVLDRKITLIKLDNQSSGIGARKAALEAIEKGVVAVIGSTWSSHTLGMAPTLQKAGIPTISPLSTNPKITQVGNYIFRACFTDDFQGRLMANFAQRDLKAKNAVILINASSDYSIGLARQFRKTARDLNLAILWEGRYREKDTDFSVLLEKTIQYNPEIVFAPSYSRDSALLIKQARKMGLKSTFLGGDGWNEPMIEIAGQAVEGSYGCGHWHPNVAFPKSRKLIEVYKEKFGTAIILDSPMVYDAFMILADAILRAQSLDRLKIRNALAETKDFKGISGTITFDEKGDPINRDAVIRKFENGRIIFHKTFRP